MAAGFETTDWTLVRNATGSGRDSRAALARLCDAYWYPLYAFARHLGYSSDDAADLVQGFFTVLLEKHYLEDVNPQAGRFRTFMLSSLKHFLSNERAKSQALKRGGGQRVVSLDSEAAERRWAYEPVGGKTPEDVFERRWARTVLDHALGRLRIERTAVGKGREFELLTPFLTGEEPHPAYSDVAEQLGVSVGAVRVAVHRLRNQFGDLLRHEIRRTVTETADVDGEVRYLLNVLGVSDPHR